MGNKLIFINIKPQGSKKELKFLFDTGAYSSISEDFVNKLDGEVKDYQFSTKDVNGNSVHQTGPQKWQKIILQRKTD